MWGQLGLQRDESDEEPPQQSPGGNLWSRFVQVAADVAQDLAQPNDKDDDEEEEGWNESLGVEGTQSWDEQQQGRYAYQGNDQQYFEEGEQQQYYEDDGQQYYEGDQQYEEHYQGEDGYEYDQQPGEVKGWGDDEEVDFSLEADDQHQGLQQPSDEPLFAGSLEQHQQPAVKEHAVADPDQWDLEDEDLFGDGHQEEQQEHETDFQTEQPAEQKEEPTSEEEHDGFLGDVVEDNTGDNGWGHDDSLNFDESQLADTATETLVETPVDKNAVEDDAADAADAAWSQGDLALDDLTETAATGHDEPENATVQPTQANTTANDRLPQSDGDGWTDGFGGFDDSLNVDEGADAPPIEKESGVETSLEPPPPSGSMPSADVAQAQEAVAADQKEGDGWNEDFGFDDSHNLDDQEVDAAKTPMTEHVHAPTDCVGQEIITNTAQATSNEIEQGEGDGWNEDFNFDDSRDVDPPLVQDESEVPVGSAGLETPTSSDSMPPGDTHTVQETGKADHVEGGGWNEDFDFENSQNMDEAEGSPLETAAETPVVEEVSQDISGEGDQRGQVEVESEEHSTSQGQQLAPVEAEQPETDPIGDAINGDGWGDEDVDVSSHHEGVSESQTKDTANLESGNTDDDAIITPAAAQGGGWNEEDDLNLSGADVAATQPDAVAAPDETAEEDAWNDSGFEFDEEDELNVAEDDQSETHEQYVSAVPGAEAQQLRKRDEADCDDDSTVEQSNIGAEQTSDDPKGDKQPTSEEASGPELTFTLPGRTPSRRATIRASNTSSACISRRDSEDDDSEPFNEKILGTSVMFADLTVGCKTTAQKPIESSGEEGRPKDEAISTGEKEDNEAPIIRDNVSSVSDTSAELPKPTLQTQISMMTLKSMADSCPSRQRGNDSDEDDEDKFGPVVDKTPEVSSSAMPETSTMTITSTAVVANSVAEDIQRDDEMDGTYYGSVAAEGQSNENAWEEDDASSLGGLHDLGDKQIVNFVVSASPIAPQGDPISAPLQPPSPIQEERATMTPPLNESMAIVYSDDHSVPSRDKDDDNEDDYKPVVDQVPKPPQNLKTEKSGRTLNSMSVVADNVGTMTIEERGEGEEDGWDDDGASLDDSEGINATKEEAGVVVDNTPGQDEEACSTGGKSGGSLAAVESADNSCPSRVHDSDEEVYGLVVDQIPTSPPPLMDQMSVAASSMAVVAHNVEEDLKQDEDLDASDHGGSTIDGFGVSSWENDQDLDGLGGEDKKAKQEKDESVEMAPSGDKGGVAAIDVEVSPDGDRVVDLTPKMEGRKVSRLSSNSLAVLAHSVNHDFGDNDEDEDDANFGPIVDITPTPKKTPAVTPNSTAVQAANIGEDIKQDETTEGGVGEVNWDDECPELEDMELGEEDEEEVSESEAVDDSIPPIANTQANPDQVVLVDHTPEGETPRKLMGDASLAVLAPSEDGTCASINDDDDVDNIDPSNIVSYGPVVDVTPTLRMEPIGARSTAPSVTFSLAVEARSVDEDYQMDDEMDETFCGDTTTCEAVGENGWEDDQTLDTLDIDQSRRPLEPTNYKLQASNDNGDGEVVVDHTPQLNSPEPRLGGDASLIALAPSVASTYRSADDDANDDDTITQEEDLYGKVVDHTPRLAPVPLGTSGSMAVGASSTDYRSEMERDEDLDNTIFGESTDGQNEGEGWGEDETALDGIETNVEPTEETMVDHTPVTEGRPKLSNVDPSVAVLAPSDDGSREDDNDTYDEQHVFGPVVDMTPQMPSTNDTVMSSSVAARHEGDLGNETLNGDSVGPDTGWDEDDAALDDLVAEEKETESVDQNPSDANLWQHAELTSDNASSRMEGSTIGKSLPDVASSQDGVVLVDHTPSEIDSSAQKNSISWLANVESGISGDETEDNDAVAGPNAQAEEDQVVDRIPQRPESRFGDASTLVVADPSEVLSHVGDMLQEEGDFGPVVDLTPPSRPGLPSAISAAGSTIVVASTIAPDDLDDADADDTVNAAEDNGWEQDPSELEQTPNPQSGNEEETTQVREQVVDFLPPQGEDQVPDQNRDGWSEVATGGAPSVFQADPKEDEFGPVVDQLPLPLPSTPFSAISTASQVAASECDALAGEDETEDGSKQERNSSVVDPLPRPFEVAVQNLDSTASLAQSLASEDDEDDGKYGPVVDHLPSIRSSLPPSRGGSTVDALATVSEVANDDDDDDEGDDASSDGGGNDGWGDDDLGEIDLSEHHEPKAPQPNRVAVSEPKSRPDDQSNNSQDRGMTVRFRSVVAAIFESNGNGDGQGADASTGNQDLRPRTESSRIFHDDDNANAGEPNAWNDDLDFDVSLNADPNRDISILSSPERYTQFAEADTPPATPYSRPKQAHHETNGIPPGGVALPDLTLAATRASLQCNTCENASTIDCPCVQRILKQKEDGDDTIKIDYTKLLQTEISKRLLIEEESKDVRSQFEALKQSKSAGEVRMETVRTLQEHVKIIEAKLKESRNACDDLNSKNQKLKTSLDEGKKALLEWEDRQKQWSERELTLRDEATRAAQKLDDAKRAREEKEQKTKTEMAGRQELMGRLENQLGTLQTECSSLRADSSSLTAEVQSLRDSLEKKQKEIRQHVTKRMSYEANIKALQGSISELEKAVASAQETRNQYLALQADFAAKESAFAKLQADLLSLQKASQAAEADRSHYEKLSTQNEEEVAKNQSELTSLQRQLEDIQRMRDEDIKEQGLRLKELDTEIQRLTAGKEAQEKKVLDLQSSSESAANEATKMLSQKESELENALAQLGYLQEQNSFLEIELENLNSVSEKAARLEEELHASNEENGALVGALREADENAKRLQQSIADQGVEESEVERNKNSEIESLVAERADLRNTIASNGRQIQALETKLSNLCQLNGTLENDVAQVKSSCDQFKLAAENSQRESTETAENQSKLIQELEGLQQEVASLLEERDEVHMEREMLLQRSKELESSLSAAIEESDSNVGRIRALEENLSEAQRELTTLREANASLAAERNQYIAKCQGLEQLVGDSSKASEEVSRLLQENTSLADQARSIQQEFDNQGVVLQNFEARMAALENELSAERDSSVAKDEAMAALKQEFESTRASLEESAAGASGLPQKIAELEVVVSRLETERHELAEGLALHASKEQEFQEIAQSLTNERDTAMAENEDMLVQFGLLNEQMEQLKDLVQRYESASETTDTRLLELQQRLTAAESAKPENDDGLQAIDGSGELQDLRNEQSRLIQEIQVLTNANSEKETAINSISEELESVRAHLSVLEELKANAAAMASENDQLHTQVGELESQRNELDETRKSQVAEISGLQSEIEEAHDIVSEWESRFGMLEEACSNRDQALQQKEVEMRELVTRLHEASGSSSVATQEILDLRERLNSLEVNGQETTDQIHILTASYEKSQEELVSSRGQISTLETSLNELEEVVACKDQDFLLQAEDHECALNALENKLQSNSKEVAELTKQNHQLSTEVSTLFDSLEAAQSKLHAKSAGEESLQLQLTALQEEMESLKEEGKNAQDELQARSTEGATSAKSAEAELESLKLQMTAWQEEIESLKEERNTAQAELQARSAEGAAVAGSGEAELESLKLKLQITKLQEEVESLKEERNVAQMQLQARSAASDESAEIELESLKIYMTALQEEMKLVKEERSAIEEELNATLAEETASTESREAELELLKTRMTALLEEMESVKDERNTALEELNAKLAQGSPTGSSEAELESLKIQMAALQKEMKPAKEKRKAHEEFLQSDIDDLKRTMAKKDGEVVMLKHKVQSLSVQLGESITQVQSKEDEILKLASEMDELRQEQENVHRGAGTSAAMLLQHTKENAEDVISLKKTVISLASALEESEGRRADAIDRLLRERETYADSLRHMSDSVKRFYNTLSFGEP